MRRPRSTVLAAGLLALAALAGCTASDDSGGDAGFAGDGAPERAGAPPGEDGGGETGGVAGGVVIDTRSIIYTGSITIRVPDVDRAARLATELAERYGGFVGADQRSAPADPEGAQATLELRIPAGEFPAAVAELATLGQEESREIDTRDVTEEVVDLATRVATAEASVARTRALLERADSIEDIVRVEGELSEREAALASLQARQRRLADLTTLSTITATLLAREATVTEDGDRTGFVAGLAAGWRGFTGSMTVLLTGLGVLLPWLVLVGIPAGAAVWWTRRRHTPRAAPEPGPVPGPATEGRQ